MHSSGRLPVNEGELYFETAGVGDPVVFLHGFGLDLRMWDPQFEAFQSRFRVIRYDLRGFGRSSLPPVSPHAHEDDLNTLLLHLGAVPAHVVGLSMGGRMALRFAAVYPQSIRSLVLADSAMDGQIWTEDWQKRWSGMIAAARAGNLTEAKRQWLAHPLFDRAKIQPAAAALLVSMIEDYSGWHWHNRDSARAPAPPSSERLSEIRVSSLIITGERDIPDFQLVAETLAAGLPNVQRAIIPGSGHMVNLEAPDRFNDTLLNFWAEQARN
jgi:3-oxoadipate enol-lactonase